MNWDGALLLWIQNVLRGGELDSLMTAFTHLGDKGAIFLIAAVWLLCFPRTRRAGQVALTALAIGFLCTNVALKHLVSRPRPWLDVAGLIPLIEEEDPNSFPSGHTCAAFTFAAALWGTLPVRWGKLLALGTALLMGFSRLYVGVHYPTDVLAGLLVGTLAGVAAVLLWKRLAPEGKGRVTKE